MYNNYKIRQVINVTDVGHLTSDSDEGDDKVEKAAKKENKTVKQITEHYFNAFKKDLKKLNVLEPSAWPRATMHVREQIDLVQILEKKGFTYQTSDGIYFDTSKLKDYGKIALLNKEGLQEGKRVSIGEKKNKTDFALWKFSTKGEKRQQEWDSPWGVGFPGWHLECSAMSSRYLGKQFDIHTGGIDHIPIHHTNEIAQSEAAFGKKPWVKYWLHGAFLTFQNQKMSKSSGKILTISELEEKGFSALDYRYFCLTTHYRKGLVFSIKNLESSKTSLQKLKNLISKIKEDKKSSKKYLKEFEKAINDDLNMPKALQTLWKLVRDKKAQGKLNTIKEIDKVFSLDLLKQEKIKVPKSVQELAQKRQKARKDKDWKLADKLREKVNKLGYILNDTKEGFEIKKN